MQSGAVSSMGASEPEAEMVGVAEDVAVSALDNILMDCERVIERRYYQNQAFHFAAESAEEAALSQVRMCFVAHDPPENTTDWQLEPEPAPGRTDAWARLQLVQGVKKSRSEPLVRRNAIVKETNMASISAVTKSHSEFPKNVTSGASEGSSKSFPSKSTSTLAMMRRRQDFQRMDPRAYSIKQDSPVDEEEERLRAKHAQKLMELRKASRQDEVAQEEESQQKNAFRTTEEAVGRPYALDSHGNIIWIKAPAVEELPELQKIFPFAIGESGEEQASVSGNGRAGAPAELQAIPLETSHMSATARNRTRKLRRSVSRRRKHTVDAHVFTDGVHRPSYMQPPVLEMMDVKPGVVLQSMGRAKTGPPLTSEKGRMSMRDYRQLAERDAMEGREAGPEQEVNSTPSTPVSRPSLLPGEAGASVSVAVEMGRPQSAPGGRVPRTAPLHHDGGAATGEAAAMFSPKALLVSGEPLPAARAVPESRTPNNGASLARGTAVAVPRRTPSSSRSQSLSRVQTAPPAPALSTRQRKTESLGYMRPPRFHVAPLGVSAGAAQHIPGWLNSSRVGGWTMPGQNPGPPRSRSTPSSGRRRLASR